MFRSEKSRLPAWLCFLGVHWLVHSRTFTERTLATCFGNVPDESSFTKQLFCKVRSCWAKRYQRHGQIHRQIPHERLKFLCPKAPKFNSLISLIVTTWSLQFYWIAETVHCHHDKVLPIWQINNMQSVQWIKRTVFIWENALPQGNNCCHNSDFLQKHKMKQTSWSILYVLIICALWRPRN